MPFSELHDIQQDLLQWFDENHRDLPWRHTRDPYAILVSEVMLQQTQVDRVIPYYHTWLERWPNVESLAAAPIADVIRAWKGLGYNRRAVNLQKAARVVIEMGGRFPQTVEGLRQLPGVGPYTAGAIACFAYEQDSVFIDTNMRRVLHRLFVGEDVSGPSVSDRELLEIAAETIPPGAGWRWNQALIEFGARQCTARKPLCDTCPLREHCAAYPDIQSALARTSARRRGKIVPFEQTNRYFRGRIMDLLREHRGNGIRMHEIGHAVKSDFATTDYPWLLELILALESDGLLVLAHSEAEEAYGPAVAEPPASYHAVPTETLLIKLP